MYTYFTTHDNDKQINMGTLLFSYSMDLWFKNKDIMGHCTNVYYIEISTFSTFRLQYLNFFTNIVCVDHNFLLSVIVIFPFLVLFFLTVVLRSVLFLLRLDFLAIYISVL